MNRLIKLRTLVLLLLGGVVFGYFVLPALAQNLRLRGLRGEELRESDLLSQPTIVVVWASWSPRCRDIHRRVNALARRWDRRVRVITVDFQEDRDTVEKFIAGKNLRAPVFLDADGAFSKKNALTTLPSLLVFKDGNVAYRGKLPDDPDQVIGEILD
jgi:thiol-disulfide isomerase/thioredoxin